MDPVWDRPWEPQGRQQIKHEAGAEVLSVDQLAASSQHESRRRRLNNHRMHKPTAICLAFCLAVANEVWLKILYIRGTNPQVSSNLVEYGITRRRHRRIMRNNLHLHAYAHRRILKYNLDLHAHNHREILRNPHIREAYIQKYRDLLCYQPKHIFNPYSAFRHHTLLPRIPNWVPHLEEWSGPSLY